MFKIVDPMVYTLGMASLLGVLLFVILGNIFWPAQPGKVECFFPEDSEPEDGEVSAKP